MEIYSTIQSLLVCTLELGLLKQEDEVYARNLVMHYLQLMDFPSDVKSVGSDSIPDLVEDLICYAQNQGVIRELDTDKEILASKIMNVFIDKPSEVNRRFYELYDVNPEQATNYFYELSKNSNYIQTKAVAKNIHYLTDTPYGAIDITVNLSKPEKDPRQIALEKEKKQDVKYPACLLCVENEGYAGRIGHPARSNHRMIRTELGGETWYFQYSPYVYYNEHCIVLSEEHRDMKISRQSFERLLEFVEKFPHYFVGSNADLPIVGGSILTHDHYQGGRYEFAMAKAPEEMSFVLKNYPEVHAATVKWPMSVIRLRAASREVLVDAADEILREWQSYSDVSVEILASTGDTPHNTITPIARRRGLDYELDLVLRNNRTNGEFPLGIFHPHEDVHHIKKENIGLIEVMGLAVLPARLTEELEQVAAFLLGNQHNMKDYHVHWAYAIRDKYLHEINEETVESIVKREVGLKFQRVLEDAGVFKRDSKGQAAFHRFCHLLGF